MPNPLTLRGTHVPPLELRSASRASNPARPVLGPDPRARRPAARVAGTSRGAASTSPRLARAVPDARVQALRGLDVWESTRPGEGAAQREVVAHLRKLGLDEGTRDPLRAVAAAELAVAQSRDPRVSEAAMSRAVERCRVALDLEPDPQVQLLGFTALIDGKFSLNGPVITALAAEAEKQYGREALLEAIDLGPGVGEYAPKSPAPLLDLTARLIRHLLLGGGASLQLQLPRELVGVIEACAERSGAPIQQAMGGAAAFAANLASAQPHVEAHFYSERPLAEGIARRFSPGVKVIGSSGTLREARAAGDPTRAPRVNYVAEYPSEEPFQVAGEVSARVDGKMRPLVTPKTWGRVILGTPSEDLDAFGGLDAADAASLGAKHDLAFLGGMHYFTRGTSASCRAQSERLSAQLEALKSGNPEIVRHWQYVIPKQPENEAALFEPLRGKFDSISLNAVEVPDLLDRLAAANLVEWPGTPNREREAVERPSYLLSAGHALLSAVGTKRVHVHGLHGDLVVFAKDAPVGGARPTDPERQVVALVKDRQVGSMKAANASGEIRSPAEMWPLLPVVEGESLAAVEDFADCIAARYGLDASARDRVAASWWHAPEPNAAPTEFFVPSRGIHDRTGGLVSLGDTIDAVALTYALRPGEQPKRSFAEDRIW